LSSSLTSSRLLIQNIKSVCLAREGRIAFFVTTMKKEKNGSKEEHEVKHMQTHVNTPAKNHNAQRYHLSLWF